jgi:hypothetical protein
MTAKTLHLGKLLKFFGLIEQPLITELRKELRAERKKLNGIKSEGGGDFHVAFWSDAKLHVIGIHDLIAQTETRIDVSPQRRRLYPLLADGFLEWLNRLKRSTNERVGWREGSVHNHFEIPDFELTLKVDNLLCLKIGDERYRLIYPYFSEKPILSEKWARVGLWLMSEALPDHDIADMEILDVLRGRSFAGGSTFLKGDEEMLFAQRYRDILTDWDALRPHYNL